MRQFITHFNPKIVSASSSATKLILHGTFAAILLLLASLYTYHLVTTSIWLPGNLWVLFSLLAYLLAAEILLKYSLYLVVNWLLILFYLLIAFSTQLNWGLNTPVSMLTIGFAVLLPSILLNSRYIFPITALAVSGLLLVQTFFNLSSNPINLDHLSEPSSYWDVATYTTVLGIFALVSWVASKQREKNEKWAQTAENRLRAQKENLATELEKESARLRAVQLNEIKQLHKFALIGQTTTATLHDLANHLSILSLDIEDLHQQHTHSRAIHNAKESIHNINKMVGQARRQLNSYDGLEKFNAITIINRSVKDTRLKFSSQKIKILKSLIGTRKSFIISNNSIALMQVMTILLNNAHDACIDAANPEIKININCQEQELTVSISDNGHGVPETMRDKIFQPKNSEKNSGLGIGLYIAHHLVVDQLKGRLWLAASDSGANFVFTIPKVTSQ